MCIVYSIHNISISTQFDYSSSGVYTKISEFFCVCTCVQNVCVCACACVSVCVCGWVDVSVCLSAPSL